MSFASQRLRSSAALRAGKSFREPCKLTNIEKPNEYGRYWTWVFWELEVSTVDFLHCDEARLCALLVSTSSLPGCLRMHRAQQQAPCQSLHAAYALPCLDVCQRGLTSGRLQVCCRAWDWSQNTQPREMTWTLLGQGNNSEFRVKAHKETDEEACSALLACVQPDRQRRQQRSCHLCAHQRSKAAGLVQGSCTCLGPRDGRPRVAHYRARAHVQGRICIRFQQPAPMMPGPVGNVGWLEEGMQARKPAAPPAAASAPKTESGLDPTKKYVTPDMLDQHQEEDSVWFSYQGQARVCLGCADVPSACLCDSMSRGHAGMLLT
jgi:Mo-co oxidoreductase dimerisation domain